MLRLSRRTKWTDGTDLVPGRSGRCMSPIASILLDSPCCRSLASAIGVTFCNMQLEGHTTQCACEKPGLDNMIGLLQTWADLCYMPRHISGVIWNKYCSCERFQTEEDMSASNSVSYLPYHDGMGSYAPPEAQSLSNSILQCCRVCCNIGVSEVLHIGQTTACKIAKQARLAKLSTSQT